ncbi:MAG: hypothetical protein AVDCRST_MAG58-2287, partial [uncultured Rubrobacteraceae bacterium]
GQSSHSRRGGQGHDLRPGRFGVRECRHHVGDLHQAGARQAGGARPPDGRPADTSLRRKDPGGL